MDGLAAGLSALMGVAGMSGGVETATAHRRDTLARVNRGAFSAAAGGMRRVGRAPTVLVGVWLLTVLVCLPLTLALRDMLAQHLGSSLAADAAAAGVNYDWMQEFGDQATGVGVTFKPTILGFGAVLDNMSAFLDYTNRPVVIVGAAAAYVALWMFLAGGIIDRYARDRVTHTYGFFAASGAFFFRLLRLAIVQWVVYAFIFGWVHGWLFDRLFVRMTHDLTAERTAFFIRVLLYLVFGALLAAANLLFDYAKIRAVVEDRRSMIGALAAATRFVRHNGGVAVTLYLLNFGLFLSVVAIYAIIAPGAGGTGASMWFAFAIGQAYIAARLAVKLLFWASEVVLFQNRFAHAGYLASPQTAWPDSPAVEAIKTSN
jgi:hypothetical protein